MKSERRNDRLVYCSWEPQIGFWFMMFLVPVEGLYVLAGTWIAIAKIVGVLTFASLLSKAQLRQGMLRFDRQSKWMLAFAAWVGISLLWGKQEQSAPFMAMTMAQLALFWVLMRAIITTKEEMLAVSLFFIGRAVLAIIVSAIFPRWGAERG